MGGLGCKSGLGFGSGLETLDGAGLRAHLPLNLTPTRSPWRGALALNWTELGLDPTKCRIKLLGGEGRPNPNPTLT